MVELSERKTEIGIGLFLLIGIGAFILIPQVFPADTIILTNPSGGAPVSCLPSGGFVLAQNLTDLCDVTIISPSTNQILSYNGSQWVNVAGSVIFNDTTVCTDLNPSGNFLVCGGGNVNLKSFIEGIGIDMSQNSTNITVNSFIDCSEVGSGLGSLNSCTDNALVLKTFIEGFGIDIVPTANDLTFINTLPENTTCVNTGSGLSATLCNDGNINIKGLIESTGIDLVNNTNDVTIKTNFANGTGISITGSTSQTFTNTGVISNSCTTGVNCSGTNPSVILTDFANGTGISITGTAPQTFTNTGVISNQCDKGINCSGTNPSVLNTDFVNGTGISITGTTSQTFTNTGVTSLTSANSQISLSGSTGAITITPKMQLLCQTTLGSSNATIFCGSFTGQKTVIIHLQALSTGGTGIEPAIRFNSDGGNNYSFRVSSNGGADATVTSTSRCNVLSSGSLIVSTNGLEAQMIVYDMLSSDRKLVVGDSTNGINSSAGTAPNRNEFSCKWDNSSSLITSVTAIINTGTGSYNTNSQLTVWGYS